MNLPNNDNFDPRKLATNRMVVHLFYLPYAYNTNHDDYMIALVMININFII